MRDQNDVTMEEEDKDDHVRKSVAGGCTTDLTLLSILALQALCFFLLANSVPHHDMLHTMQEMGFPLHVVMLL